MFVYAHLDAWNCLSTHDKNFFTRFSEESMSVSSGRMGEGYCFYRRGFQVSLSYGGESRIAALARRWRRMKKHKAKRDSPLWSTGLSSDSQIEERFTLCHIWVFFVPKKRKKLTCDFAITFFLGIRVTENTEQLSSEYSLTPCMRCVSKAYKVLKNYHTELLS